MVISYDEGGNVIGTVDYAVAIVDGEVVGLHDFAAHEDQDTEFWHSLKVNGAHGHGTWPEYLGTSAHDFRVEVEGGRIARLHHKSGHVRHRRDVEAAIATAAVKAQGGPVDLRRVVGGPDRPLPLDDRGRSLTA